VLKVSLNLQPTDNQPANHSEAIRQAQSSDLEQKIRTRDVDSIVPTAEGMIHQQTMQKGSRFNLCRPTDVSFKPRTYICRTIQTCVARPASMPISDLHVMALFFYTSAHSSGRKYYILPLKFLSFFFFFFFRRRISEMAPPTGNLSSSDGRM